jgi:thiosulfate dehydrogenase [quinone] large subunit
MKSDQGTRPNNQKRQAKAIAFTRIAFGLIWAIDAYFKWQPAFANNFLSYLQETYDGQPAAIQSWLDFWINLTSLNPHLFARIVALGESAIAIGLILGLFSNLDYFGGILLTLLIWTIPEGFGGPYSAGATDLGAGIIYVFGFLGLWLLAAGQYYGLDKRLWSILGRWNFLCSGPMVQEND